MQLFVLVIKVKCNELLCVEKMIKRLGWLSICAVKIICRYIFFFLQKRELKLNSFTCSANFCIDGTLNQLQWDVENALYITIDSSSRIYFGSGEYIFKVSKEKTQFELKCYGFGKRIKANVHLKIIQLVPNDFHRIFPKNPQQ